jgi:hypothetical protein
MTSPEIPEAISGFEPVLGYLVSRTWFDTDFVVHGFPKLLLAAEVPLGSLNRNATQQELNLFQFSPCSMTETGTRSSKMPHAAFPQLCRTPYYADVCQSGSADQSVTENDTA